MNQTLKKIAKKMGVQRLLYEWNQLRNIPNILRFIRNEKNAVLDDFNVERFKEVYNSELKNFQEYKNKKFENFVMPEWADNIQKIEKFVLNKFDEKFLRNRLIQHTMFVANDSSWQINQIGYLENLLPKEKLGSLLREIKLGGPYITLPKYNTSTNTIHNLYHLEKFKEETGVEIATVGNVAEFGGGYGNLARIFRKFNPNATYTIIDLPVFSFIQSVYLKTIFGEEMVNVIKTSDEKIEKGKINLVPLDLELLTNLQFGEVDLFVSTWALSETTKVMQEFVKKLNYFNARYILLAYQKNNSSFFCAENVTDLDDKHKVSYSAPTAYVGNNYYLFGEKK